MLYYLLFHIFDVDVVTVRCVVTYIVILLHTHPSSKIRLVQMQIHLIHQVTWVRLRYWRDHNWRKTFVLSLYQLQTIRQFSFIVVFVYITSLDGNYFIVFVVRNVWFYILKIKPRNMNKKSATAPFLLRVLYRICPNQLSSKAKIFVPIVNINAIMIPDQRKVKLVTRISWRMERLFQHSKLL
jgi:hypothetical protein